MVSVHKKPCDQIKVIRVSGRRDLSHLPPPNTMRWVVRRKAHVVTAVRNGLLSVAQACERYRLSEEEFQSWVDLLDKHGVPGLRATRMQDYHPALSRRTEPEMIPL